MSSGHLLWKFRAAWLSSNLTLLALRLLSQSALGEWDLLSRLRSRYRVFPSQREVARLRSELVEWGLVRIGWGPRGEEIQITAAGAGCLARMEEEYRSLVSGLVEK